MNVTATRRPIAPARILVFVAALVAAGALSGTASAFSIEVWIKGAGTVNGNGIGCTSPLNTPTGSYGDPDGSPLCNEDYGSFSGPRSVTAVVPSGWTFGNWTVVNKGNGSTISTCTSGLTCTVGNLFDGTAYRITASFMDVTPPSISLNSGPTNGSFTTSTSATFTFSTSDSVASFRCSLDGAAATICSSPQTYTGLVNGGHSFSVFARDPSGNVSSMSTRTWTVDTVAPVATINSGPSGPSNSAGAAFGFASNEAGTLQCGLAGPSAQAHAFTTCTSPRSYTGLADGSYSFQVRAFDPAGNVSSVVSRAWIVDTVAPTTPAVSQGAVTASSITANWTPSTDAGGVTGYEVFLNGASVSTLASAATGHTFSGLQCGTVYTVGVEALDAATNRSSRGNASITTSACPPPPPPPPPPPAANCGVPALKGKTLAQARTLLNGNRCALGRVTRAYHATIRVGRIVKQSPLAGRRLAAGAKVSVVVSRGRR